MPAVQRQRLQRTSTPAVTPNTVYRVAPSSSYLLPPPAGDDEAHRGSELIEGTMDDQMVFLVTDTTPHETTLVRQLLGRLRTQEATADAASQTILDSLVPRRETTVSPEIVQQIQMRAAIVGQIRSEFGLLTSGEVADVLGSQARNRAATANRLVRDKKIFCLQLHGQNLYPGFQFADGHVRPAIAPVITALGPLPGVDLAAWFMTHDTWLDNARPVDVLMNEADEHRAAGQLRTSAEHAAI